MLDLSTWFDPYDAKHMEAARILFATGYWPEEFLPEGIQIRPNWLIDIQLRMAVAWVKNFKLVLEK